VPLLKLAEHASQTGCFQLAATQKRTFKRAAKSPTFPFNRLRFPADRSANQRTFPKAETPDFNVGVATGEPPESGSNKANAP